MGELSAGAAGTANVRESGIGNRESGIGSRESGVGSRAMLPAAALLAVIPAKAGIQRLQRHGSVKPWIPAFAGMTPWGRRLAPGAETRIAPST